MYPVKNSLLALWMLPVLLMACTGRRTKAPTRENPETPVEIHSAAVTAAKEADQSCIVYPDGSKLVDSLYYLRNDTTFLCYRVGEHSGTQGYTKAYIVRDHGSEPYRELHRIASLGRLDVEGLFEPGETDLWSARELREQLRTLRESHPGPLPVHDLDGCPQTWIPLATLRGKHYVDRLDCYPLWITDSLYIQQFMDGPLPARIRSFEHPAPAHYRLRIVGPSYPEPGWQVDIHLIDPVRKIAVIVFRDHDTRYGTLYGALEEIDQFDLVDWLVTDRPCGDEIPWDEIDCLALVPEEACSTETAVRESTAGGSALETEDTNTEK